MYFGYEIWVLEENLSLRPLNAPMSFLPRQYGAEEAAIRDAKEFFKKAKGVWAIFVFRRDPVPFQLFHEDRLADHFKEVWRDQRRFLKKSEVGDTDESCH
jgi:hypothetical protein